MFASTFVRRAACDGHRPTQLSDRLWHERPILVGQLLKDRGVPRAIVAPRGYGKTFLAAQYAETVHSWRHVFWVNAQSPCFVRDLDAGKLVESVFEVDEAAALIVFEDVPVLGAGRDDLFSGAIDKLIARGCEVVVTCAPASDARFACGADCALVNAADLLLDDEELDAARLPDERSRKSADQLGSARRVPSLVWGSDPERMADFARGLLTEELPSEVLGVMAASLVLQKGNLSDLDPLDYEIWSLIARDYPHLDADFVQGTFESPQLPIDAVANALRKQLAQQARQRGCAPDEIVRGWATCLLEAGEPARACDAVRHLMSGPGRPTWAAENGFELVRKACFFPMLLLFTTRKGVDDETLACADALEAFCRRMLGDERGAVRCAKRRAFDEGAPQAARVLSQLIAVRSSSGQTPARAREELIALAERAEARNAWDFWPCLARAWRAGSAGIAEMSRFWNQAAAAGADPDALSVCTSWLFALHEVPLPESSAEIVLVRSRAERFVREKLEECADDLASDYFVASAGLSMEEAHARGVEYQGGPIAAGALIALRRVEMNVLSQRRMLEEEEEVNRARQADWMATHPMTMDSLVNGQSQVAGAPAYLLERAVPVLSLRMFGRFEVLIGGRPVENARFERQNTRVLLVLLAVNLGRELSRDAVMSAMWPNSPAKAARKNFYTVWAHLRRALSLPDGTCPYLLRHQYGCSLDGRYVQSDVGRFNEICRELLFSTPNIERWSSLFSEIDRDFTCELMPSEQGNPLVLQARDDYRDRLVDALVAATLSVVDSENAQWGIWFARAAIGRDETREDAYVALMRAQIAMNQRTAAMMTYLACRRVLAEKLGIDPAPETTALYESLLDFENARAGAAMRAQVAVK